jgi:hypothetical protein
MFIHKRIATMLMGFFVFIHPSDWKQNNVLHNLRLDLLTTFICTENNEGKKFMNQVPVDSKTSNDVILSFNPMVYEKLRFSQPDPQVWQTWSSLPMERRHITFCALGYKTESNFELLDFVVFLRDKPGPFQFVLTHTKNNKSFTNLEGVGIFEYDKQKGTWERKETYRNVPDFFEFAKKKLGIPDPDKMAIVATEKGSIRHFLYLMRSR